MRVVVEIGEFQEQGSGTEVRLRLSDGLGEFGCVLDLNVAPLVTRFGSGARVAQDFLLLSAVVYVVDKMVSRQLSRDAWTRELHVEIPVGAPDLWNDEAAHLAEALAFLTGDRWALTFVPRVSAVLATAGHPEPQCFDAVCLFSGGLDSLTGAVNLLAEGRKVALIGHYDSSHTAHYQSRLLPYLADEYTAERVRLTTIRCRPTSVWYSGAARPRERTLRSRSMLFLGLGVFAAEAIRGQLYVPENGLISLNVPLTLSRLGSCSTRTTHPMFLHLLRSALSGLGLTPEIVNPFLLQTKGAVVAGCLDPTLIARTVRLSVSCAHPEAIRRWKRFSVDHCGYCIPCIIRRASLYAVGMDNAQHYAYQVCEDPGILKHPRLGRDFRAVVDKLARRADARSIFRDLVGVLPPGADKDAYQNVIGSGLAEVRQFIEANGHPEVLRVLRGAEL